MFVCKCMAQLQTSSSQAPKHLGTGTIPHAGAGFWLVAQLWLSTGGSRMKVETELVLSACCNTVVIHEVLCCWETLQGAGGDQIGMLKPWLCSLMLGHCLGLGLQRAQPSSRAAFPPLPLSESLPMLFIERMSFLSCKIHLGCCSQNRQDFLW